MCLRNPDDGPKLLAYSIYKFRTTDCQNIQNVCLCSRQTLCLDFVKFMKNIYNIKLKKSKLLVDGSQKKKRNKMEKEQVLLGQKKIVPVSSLTFSEKF